MDVKELRAEREANNHAILDGICPKRVPVSLSVGAYAMAQYAGVDPRLCYWAPELLEEKAFEIAEMIPSDTSIMGRAVLTPTKYQALGSEAIKMSSNGFMQHPNTHMMEASEYDEFIEDPFAFIVEKAVPRVNPGLDFAKVGPRATYAFTQGNAVTAAANAPLNVISKKLSDKYGYFTGAMGGGGGYAPMDILSDQLRSFSGMLTDIRRCPDKVKAAVEAVSPLEYYLCAPPNPETYTRYAYGFYPFHMATFMRPKDFENLWYPALKRQWDGYASEGYRNGAFLEHNWDILLDYVADLPVGSYFTFETTDAKLIKEKLGKKMVLASGFPIEYLSQCTPEEAADKTKEWLDIMAVGGNYSFGLNKSILVAADCNLENLKAVAEAAYKYGTYSAEEVGKRVLPEFNKADYKPAGLPEFKSKYFKTWDQYLAENPNTPIEAKKYVMAAERAFVNEYVGLLK